MCKFEFKILLSDTSTCSLLTHPPFITICQPPSTLCPNQLWLSNLLYYPWLLQMSEIVLLNLYTTQRHILWYSCHQPYLSQPICSSRNLIKVLTITQFNAFNVEEIRNSLSSRMKDQQSSKKIPESLPFLVIFHTYFLLKCKFSTSIR